MGEVRQILFFSPVSSIRPIVRDDCKVSGESLFRNRYRVGFARTRANARDINMDARAPFLLSDRPSVSARSRTLPLARSSSLVTDITPIVAIDFPAPPTQSTSNTL